MKSREFILLNTYLVLAIAALTAVIWGIGRWFDLELKTAFVFALIAVVFWIPGLGCLWEFLMSEKIEVFGERVSIGVTGLGMILVGMAASYPFAFTAPHWRVSASLLGVGAYLWMKSVVYRENRKDMLIIKQAREREASTAESTTRQA